MAHRLFEGKKHAASYWKYRVSPSAELIEKILTFLEKKKGLPFELAVDVGCGSGQGTVLLANHFPTVVGTDISPAQLEVAMEHSTAQNITYRQCPAENLPIGDSSVDLLTAMSAFHWFDRPHFLEEANRILKPRGCLALLNYTMDMELEYADCCYNTLNDVCKEFYAALMPYRSPHLGACSKELYRQTYEALPYTEKECSAAEGPRGGQDTVRTHLTQVVNSNGCDLLRNRSGGRGQIFLPAGLQAWALLSRPVTTCQPVESDISP